MGLMCNKIPKEQLKPGDHIYTWRSGYSYSHHGIYVGEGKVIHLTRAPGLILVSSSPSRPSSGEDPVVSCSIEEFLCGGDLNLYEYGVKRARFLLKRGGTCSIASSDPPEDVLHRASILLEKGFGDYHLFHNNCEDFAIYCKTGFLKVKTSKFGRSGQSHLLFAASFAVDNTPYHFLPNFACLALVVFGITCFFRFGSDSGVEKVEAEKINDFCFKRRQEIGSTGRFLPAGKYIGYALMALNYWSWTPTSTVLLWIRLVPLYVSLHAFVIEHERLRNHTLKLSEHVAYIIWLLGYWYWSSESTIFLWTKLHFLHASLMFLISDRARGLKFQYYIVYTIYVIPFWYWTPKSTILFWTRLAFLYRTLLMLVFHRLGRTKHRWRLGRFFFACFVMHSTVYIAKRYF